ncbi:alpha/beta hydrolase [Prauserella oleivorans]|uniref:Alpha/beta hydrolase n=1 Tax=Prauserella oleivorans TaxID=1478153 RepID=A0ABW5W542_9PSEU
MIATRRQASSPADERAPGPDVEIRAGYRRFAGYSTRVLEVGPRPVERPAGRRHRKRNAALPPEPRLVLLHGYCDSADTWRPALAELARAGVSAIALDLPGFGDASALRSGAMLPQLDAFTAAVVKEQAALGDVVLVGNSLGGTMSLRAAQNPDLPVAGVVSIAAPGFVDTWLIRSVARYPLPLRLAASLPLPVPGFVVRAVAQHVVPRLLYADATKAEAEHVQRFLDLFPDYRSTTTRFEQARQLVGELATAYELDRISTPLLIIACGRDRLVSAASGKQLHALVPHSRLLVREDWGHCPQLDDPETLASVLSYFTTSAARRRDGSASAAPSPTAVGAAG